MPQPSAAITRGIRSLTAALVTAAMVLTCTVLLGTGRAHAASTSCHPFPDVTSSNTACQNIAWLKTKAITKPADGLYHPLGSVTRGSMTAFLFRLVNPGRPAPTCGSRPFPDVPTSSVFCGYIAWARTNHLAFGYPNGTYGPDRPVTRGAMAAYLSRLAHAGHAPRKCTSAPFTDVPVGSTFCPVIAWAAASGITFGVGHGRYGTSDPVTRQAMASFLHRIYPMVSVAGSYFVGGETDLADSDAGYFGTVFVDDTWAYWGRPARGLPACSTTTGRVDLHDLSAHWGCVRYRYNPLSGAVTIGSAHGIYHPAKHTIVLKDGKKTHTLTSTELPAPGARLRVKLQHISVRGLCMLMCTVTTTSLAMGRDGEFVLSQQSLSSIVIGTGGTWGSSYPPDQHGTYRIRSQGRILLSFANGHHETRTIAVRRGTNGKPDPTGTTESGGLVLGSDAYWKPLV